MGNILYCLIIGFILGLIATAVTGTHANAVIIIIVGILGAFVGGLIWRLVAALLPKSVSQSLEKSDRALITVGLIFGPIFSIIGAIIVLGIALLIFHQMS